MKVKEKKKAVVDSGACVACGCCVLKCPKEAIYIWKGIKAVIEEERCIGCGKCLKVCPALAVRLEVRQNG